MGKRPREKVAKHTHHYWKVEGKFTSVWKCADPDCKHFVWASQEYIVLGRSSICWECRQKFTMDDESLKEDMPRCMDCKSSIPFISDVDVDAELRQKLKSKEDIQVEKDEIEVYDPHAPDCDLFTGKECNCK